ncbi:MAG: lytic transglycosylase domain-containing protein [Candidatus Aenigmatarchaeota archaeon]
MQVALIIIAIIIIYWLMKEDSGFAFSEEIAKKVYNKWNNLALKYDAVAFPKNSLVSVVDILAIIAVESAGNEKAIGDKGKSLGLMQVGKLALIDVNRSLGTNYTFEDLLIPEINVLVGSHYLQLCFKQAVKERAKDIRYLGYRKYNAGIGRATEKNNISKRYANKVMEYRRYFENLIRK